MDLLRAAVIGMVVASCSRSPSTPGHRPASEDGAGHAEAAPGKALVLRPIRNLDIDLDRLAGDKFTPGARVLGADGTASFELPGPFPGRIAHVAADGAVTVVDGRLVADVPLRFLRDGDRMRAVSFDGELGYTAVERITAAAPWTAPGASPGPTTGCCGWWEHTLWRAAGRAPGRGLARAVTPPDQAWSVVDWHRPDAIEPVWRALFTAGDGAVVGAAVSPRADQLVLVVAGRDGAARLQTRRLDDGTVAWSAELGSPAAEWRRGDARVAYRHDGARIAVLVEDPARCESCTALEVFDAAGGARLQRFAIEAIIAPRFSTIGLGGDTAWVFEHVPRASSELSDRPERSQYEAHDAAGRARRADPGADWGLDATVWALAPRFDGPGVVALARRGHQLIWLAADRAP